MNQTMERNIDLPTYLTNRLAEIDRVSAEKQAALKKAPSGELRISRRKRRIRQKENTVPSQECAERETTFYLVTAASRSNGTYLRQNQSDLVRQLAQKRYDREVLKACQKEKNALEKCKALLPEVTGEMVYDSLGDEWKKLIEPDWLSDEEYARRWQEEPYKSFQFETGNKVFKTNRGEMVRSKSEKIIADLLDKYHVPYHYEPVVVLKDGNEVAPDFAGLNVRRREEILWEHLGMMSDARYCSRNIKKLKRYTANGYFEGDKLVCTFEAENEGLTTEYLEAVIQHYFL